MKKYFVVSDVHGYFDELKLSLDKAGFDINDSSHVFVLCGDAFDRGRQPLELLSFMKSLPDDRFIYIRGNHEDLLKNCVDEMMNKVSVGYHHYSNGTVDTICDICGITRYDYMWNRETIKEEMSPILDYIDRKCVDYAEIGDYILVHGWIPCIATMKGNKDFYIYNNDWRNADRNSWKESRWINGMFAWKCGVKESNKTIICGHWHCSWGWSHIRQKRQEFPNKSKQDWEKSFEPFVDDGIIAIDGCTAYSGIVNCIVLEIEE